MANKRQRKKRMKKLAQMKVVKLLEVTPAKIMTEKEQFQIALDRIYKGAVTPLNAYVNKNATLCFKCEKCGVRFFGKPSHVVGKVHQRHECDLPYGDVNGNRLQTVGHKNKPRNKKNKATGERFYNMVIEDYTPKQIAKELDIPFAMVTDYFKGEGLI